MSNNTVKPRRDRVVRHTVPLSLFIISIDRRAKSKDYKELGSMKIDATVRYRLHEKYVKVTEIVDVGGGGND